MPILARTRQFPRIYYILGAFAVSLFAVGCGKEEVAAEDEKSPPVQSETAGPTTADNVSPEVLTAAYRASAEALGMRDESDPNAGYFLYFDESTGSLYRLSFHGIDLAFLPEVGPILKETTEDGELRIESTLYKDDLIWIEVIRILDSDELERETAIEERIQQIQETFEKQLREE